jgi:hypothetical protein
MMEAQSAADQSLDVQTGTIRERRHNDARAKPKRAKFTGSRDCGFL